MAERTIRVICHDCNTPFEHVSKDGRATKKLCETCRVTRTRATTREHQRKRRAEAGPKQRNCQDCPADLTGTAARRLRCTPCSAAHRTSQMRAYNAQYREATKTFAEFACAACGMKLDRQGKCGTATYCAPCALAARRRSQCRATAMSRARRGTTFATHCHYCGVKFDRPRRRAKTPNRCDDCKKNRHRAYIRAYYAKQPRGYDHVRRARKMGVGYERFKVTEIFERDGWKCGICRRPILRRLRYPHSMSVSLDHKIPLSKGGHHSRLNTQASHLRCNLRKRTHVAPFGEQIPLPF